MSSNTAIDIVNASKVFTLYQTSEDRLKQMVFPKLRKVLGLSQRQYFEEFSAVNNVSLKVSRGETVGIVGGNGSGKSTLLQMICGTLHPSSGTIMIRGRIAALLELGSGFNPDFTGRENVYMNASILGLTHAETQERFEQIAEFADIGSFMDQPIKTYSSGMNVRLAFAVATNVDPDILVVDEALSVGDEAFQRKCFARIEQIKERGATILFVSHSAQTVTQLCDRALLMDAGEGILIGEPKIVVKQYQRLLGSKGVKASEARAEIIAAGHTDNLVNTSSDPDRDPQPVTLTDEAWFDPSLKSDSAVEFGDGGARIQDVHIVNQKGLRVNVLTKNVSYQLRYVVEFQNPAQRVGFGTMFKTIDGIELGGVGTNLRRDYWDIEQSGETIAVNMNFKCALQAGTYFCNAGVSIDGTDGLTYLHRIVDAICFRVTGENSAEFSGPVDFGINYTIEERKLELKKAV